MTKYDEFVESEVKRVGRKQQNKSAADLERQQNEPWVERYEQKTGNVKRYKRHIAEIKDKRKDTETIKKYMIVPDLSHIKFE